MKVCPKCGAQLDDNARFCDKCGADVNAQAAAGQGQPVPPMQPVTPPPVYNNAQTYQQAAVDTSDHTAEFSPEDISKNKVIAMCPYLFSVIGIIIALLATKDSAYVGFHVRQALKINVCLVLFAFANIIPILGWIAYGVWTLITFVLILMGFFYVCKGQAKEIPIIKSFGFLK